MILSILATVAVLAAIAVIAAALVLAETTLVYIALGLGGLSVLLLLGALLQGRFGKDGPGTVRTGGLGKSSVPMTTGPGAGIAPGPVWEQEPTGRVPAPAEPPVRVTPVGETFETHRTDDGAEDPEFEIPRWETPTAGDRTEPVMAARTPPHTETPTAGDDARDETTFAPEATTAEEEREEHEDLVKAEPEEGSASEPVEEPTTVTEPEEASTPVEPEPETVTAVEEPVGEPGPAPVAEVREDIDRRESEEPSETAGTKDDESATDDDTREPETSESDTAVERTEPSEREGASEALTAPEEDENAPAGASTTTDPETPVSGDMDLEEEAASEETGPISDENVETSERSDETGTDDAPAVIDTADEVDEEKVDEEKTEEPSPTSETVTEPTEVEGADEREGTEDPIAPVAAEATEDTSASDTPDETTDASTGDDTEVRDEDEAPEEAEKTSDKAEKDPPEPEETSGTDPEDDTDGEDTERSTKEEDAAIAYAAILDETVDADEEERDRAEGRKDSSYSG